MTKELYNELLDKRLITDNAITLDYINEHKLELKDINIKEGWTITEDKNGYYVLKNENGLNDVYRIYQTKNCRINEEKVFMKNVKRIY